MDKNTIIWIKRDINTEWKLRYFSHFQDGKVCCANNGFKVSSNIYTTVWQYYSTTNPCENESINMG